MIEDFGRKPTGIVATVDTIYVLAGAPPCNAELKKIYNAQLEEAKTFKLAIITVDEVMRRIGVEASAITDDNGNQRRPLYLHKTAGTNTYNMYSPPPDQEGIIPQPVAAGAPAPAAREARGQRTAHDNSSHNSNEEDKPVGRGSDDGQGNDDAIEEDKEATQAEMARLV